LLFTIKNRSRPTLALCAAFVALSLIARQALGLTGGVDAAADLPRHVLLGLGVILASDAVVHGALLLVLGDRYRTRYRALAEYFAPQRLPGIVASGALAAGEEMLFRGVLLDGLVHRAGVGTVPAVATTAFVFGAMHLLRAPGLAPFALWAVWEGALLGGIYLWTGSLPAVMLVHGTHDVIGFALLARERSRNS
jgi:membrane protease YdiL (CAAX protease family)